MLAYCDTYIDVSCSDMIEGHGRKEQWTGNKGEIRKSTSAHTMHK